MSSSCVLSLDQAVLTLFLLLFYRNPDSSQTIAKLEEAIAETGDLLFYCNDIINAGMPPLSKLMSRHILDLLVIPVLIPSLRPYQATVRFILCVLIQYSFYNLQTNECKITGTADKGIVILVHAFLSLSGSKTKGISERDRARASKEELSQG